jgi:hypothetical protein
MISHVKLFDSRILDGISHKRLVYLCEFSTSQKWLLLYRASEHGFSAQNFHSKCDNHANTLTIVKSTNGFIFGAYTEQLWNSSCNYKADNSAFIFSLVNKDNQPVKMKIQVPQHAIYCHSSYGPTFGNGHSLYIADNSNSNTLSHSNLGQAYRHPLFACGSNEAKTFLAGTNGFQVFQIEVFKRLLN